MSGYPTRERFSEYVGDSFVASTPDGDTIAFALVGVRPGIDSDRYSSFTLEFTGPADRPQPQETYSMAHPELGALDIFLVPVSRIGDEVAYEAVFNVEKGSDG